MTPKALCICACMHDSCDLLQDSLPLEPIHLYKCEIMHVIRIYYTVHYNCMYSYFQKIVIFQTKTAYTKLIILSIILQ